MDGVARCERQRTADVDISAVDAVRVQEATEEGDTAGELACRIGDRATIYLAAGFRRKLRDSLDVVNAL